jgi:putative PD-(D/E)XK family protein DUF4420
MTSHDPWFKLLTDDARRVHSAGKFDFFWVLLEHGMPGLMLRLDKLPDPLPQLPKLKNLTVSFRAAGSGPAFVIALKERSQVEVFETLCRDVVSASESADDIEHALSKAIQRTRRWHHLLRGGKKAGLSVDEQRGLVGELAVLRELISGLGPETAIEAWKGPTGASKDFEFIGTCVEVKTRRVAARPFVSISSAEQLADVEGCRLFLRIANVSSAFSPGGQSLHDHVNETAHLFSDTVRAFDTWEQAIYDSGYDPENDYGDRRWQLGNFSTYEVKDNFPRISLPLAFGIDSVKYALSIEACANFETDVDLIKVIRDGLENE